MKMNFTLPPNFSIFKTQPTSGVWKLLLLTIFLALGFTGAKAQVVSSYQVDQLAITPAFSLVPGKINLSPTTGSYDSGVYSFASPFAFNYGGAVIPASTAIHVSVNGFMTIGAAPAVTETQPISSAAAYTGVISPYGADVDVITASAVHNVGWNVTGTAPNRIIKVEWHANRSTNTTAAVAADGTNNFIFQAWIYETTNVIEFHYNTLTLGAGNVTTLGQVGLRGSATTDFRNLNFQPASGNWPVPASPMVTSTVGSPLPAESAYAVKLKSPSLGGTTIAAASIRTIRFTPVSCSAPSGVANSLVTSSTAAINWTAPSPAPADGYEYFVSTSVVPTGSTTPTGSVAAGITTLNLTGLTAATNYCIYVRSVCDAVAPTISAWSVATCFTTGCTPVNTPYGLFFDPLSDSFAVPALPVCTSRQQVGTGNLWVTENASFGDGFFDEHLVYNASGTDNANVWFYTQGVNLVAGTTYRLSYLYGGSTEFSDITNRMEVAYGTAPYSTAMTTQLANHPNIKASPIENIVNFTATATGTFYFGFRAYSLLNMGKLFLDDIQVVEPGCQRITTIASGTITGTSALLTWTEPTPAPGDGYAYYLSTSATPPAYTATASGTTPAGTNVVTITGLTGSTTYYFWVRGICGPGDQSEWSPVFTFTTPAQPVYTYCTPNPSSVDGVGIVNVNVGTINNSTGAEPGNYGNYSSMITNIAQGQTVTVNITFNTSFFNYNTKIWIDWNNDSDFYDAGENVYTGLSASTSPNTLVATFVVPAGASLGEHRMRIGGADIDTLTGTGAGQGPCYNGSWGTFEDYTVNVVIPPPALTLNINQSTQCALTNSPLVFLTAGGSSYDTYSWSPSIGVTGNENTGWTFNNSSTITYTLTATQTSLPFSTNSVSYTYFANPLPTPITLTPSSASTCGSAVQINATGGIVAGLPILSEDFNGTAPGWVAGTGTSPAHGGGNTAAALWTLRPSGYNPGGASGISSVISNDATQFYISNSDAQGSGTQTNVTLTSPVFSLAGYTSASLSFYHYYKPWINGSGKVYISTNGGGTFTEILNWGSTATTVAQGTPTNFANVIYDLSAYLTQTNLVIRFEYIASWGYVWALDNFLISGSATSAITWTPVAGLFTDAAATIPYTAGSGTNTVYAKPASTTTYTASASTPAPTVCTRTSTATITINSTTYTTAWSNGVPDATKTAIFDGNYTSTGNMNACSVIVQSGNVVFNPGHTLTVQNSVTRTGGTLTFEDDASLVQVSNTAVNSGYITYKRTSFPMRRFDYTYWSSPLSPQTLVGFSPLTLSDKYFRFDTAVNNFVNVAANSIMNVGQGYIVRAPQPFSTTVPAPFTAIFNGGANDGVPNNGIYTRPVVFGGQNYNLLGNPYPSAIDADLFYAANSSIMNGMFYFWTHNTPITGNVYTGSDYAMYNAVGGVGTAGGGSGNTAAPTGNISAGQGFFIRSTANGTATFNNSMRLTGLNNQFFRMANAQATPTFEKHRIWLEMTNAEGAYKQTLVGYVESATNERDNGFDGDVLEAGNVISLYSVLGEDNLGIQGRALPFDVTDQVPLGYMSSIDGAFQIALSQFDGLFNTQDIYLEDKLLNVIHDLKSGAYSFTTLTGTFEDRFVLRYDGAALGTDDLSLDANSVTVYKNDSGIHVHTAGYNMDTVEVYDIRGRRIFAKSNIDADVMVISGLNISEQVLVVKVISLDNKTVSKKIVY